MTHADVTFSDSQGGFLVPPDMAALIFPFSPRRDMRTGRTFDPTLQMPRRLKKAARKYRDGSRLGWQESKRLWSYHRKLIVRRFVEGDGDLTKKPVGFLNGRPE